MIYNYMLTKVLFEFLTRTVAFLRSSFLKYAASRSFNLVAAKEMFLGSFEY